MDILKMAVDSGLHVVPDGCVDREDSRSVIGSLQALQRFADALCTTMTRETQGVQDRDDWYEPLVDCLAISKLIEADPLMLV